MIICSEEGACARVCDIYISFGMGSSESDEHCSSVLWYLTLFFFVLILEDKNILSPAPNAGDSTPQPHSLWADKYRPLSTKQIIGQQGDRSNMKKLTKWLQEWHSNHSGKKKLVRPSGYLFILTSKGMYV